MTSKTAFARGAVMALLMGGLLSTGCTKKTDTTMTDSTGIHTDSTGVSATPPPGTTVDTSHSTAMPPGGPAGDVTAQNLTDANIMALMGEGDSMEVTVAKAVLAKTKNADVKALATLLQTDHARMKKEGEALAKKLNMVPQPPTNDPKPGELTNKLSMVNSAPDAASVDTFFVNDAVRDHQSDLDELKKLQAKAQNADLKSAIDKAIPVIQKHLDRAKSVQDKLSKLGSKATATTMEKK